MRCEVSLSAGFVARAVETVFTRIGTAIDRSGSGGSCSAKEQVVEDEDRIGQVEISVIGAVAGIRAIRTGDPEKEDTEDVLSLIHI